MDLQSAGVYQASVFTSTTYRAASISLWMAPACVPGKLDAHDAHWEATTREQGHLGRDLELLPASAAS
jgi:hypothetical protein